jgi:hypothetical protein
LSSRARKIIVACIFCLPYWLVSLHSVAAGELRSNWTAYFGAAGGDKSFDWLSYLESKTDPVPWAGSLRGVGREVTGMPLATVSQGNIMGDSAEFRRFEKKVTELITRRDLVIPVTGQLKARDKNKKSTFFDMVTKDNAETWKKVVYTQAVRLARLPHGLERIYWQVGNEINSREFSELVQAWKGGYGPATPDDNRIIPIYAEYYFAPTIEALQRASRDLTGVEEKIHVVLGSVAGAFRPTTLKWLDDLLKYRIEGDYAKTLAGKQVYELIDVIAIHYLATWDDTNWMTKFQELYHSWKGKGRIRGIWSTEEGGIALGKRNQGAYAALKVAARYLHYLGLESLTPDQVRCFLWGWQLGTPGTTGNDAMTAIYGFLGNTTLTELENHLTLVTESNSEYYLFQSDADKNKRFGIIFARDAGETLNISKMSMKGAGWTRDVDGRAVVFLDSGVNITSFSLKNDQNGYRISPENCPVCSKHGTLVLFLNQRS